MRTARLCLLLFLALLLPLRGAVASAMLCGAGLPPAAAHAHHHAQQAPDGAAAGHGAEHHHAHHAPAPTHDAQPAADTCNLCAASCGLTPLPSAPPAVLAPPEGAAAPFPEVDAPPASFLSDGQERPPRST